MSLTLAISGTAVSGAIPPSSIAAQSIAKDGDVGFGGFVIDDPAASITTTGHKMVTIEESACSQPRLFTGYLTDRDMGRSTDRGMIVDDDRLHDTTLVDLNAVFSFRLITETGGNRPEETVSERLTWLLGYQALSPFIADTGFVTTYTQTMDAADYRAGSPRSVLDDCATRIPNVTYFAFWDATAGTPQPSLYFGPDATGIAESTLAISNDIADIDGSTIFPPDSEATLKRTPEEVYSEVIVNYLHGTKRVYRKRASTATAYVARGTTIDRPYTGRKSTAQAQAERFLDMHSKERDVITVTIIVPPESAGLVVAGQRMDVKFVHLPGYEDWVSMRVNSVNVRPTNDVANRYALDLELEYPVVADTPPTPTCNGTAASSALNGITPTYASSGASNIPTDLANSTDGDNLTYAFWNLALGSGTITRDFIFTLPAPVDLTAVTVQGEWYGLGIGDYSTARDKFSVILGTAVYDSSYATGRDRDIWTYMDDPGTYDLYYSSIATWRFGETVSNIGTVTLRCTESFGGLGAYKTIRLNEIATCDGATPTDEEEDLGQTPGSTATRELVTPQPDGTETEFSTSQPYIPGSLTVWVDGIAVVSSEVIETDPGSGLFTLTWAPDADERIEAAYTVA